MNDWIIAVKAGIKLKDIKFVIFHENINIQRTDMPQMMPNLLRNFN